MKNIPVPNNKREHKVQTIQSVHTFVNKCRWEAKTALKPFGKEKKETWGFRSTKAAPKGKMSAQGVVIHKSYNPAENS